MCKVKQPKVPPLPPQRAADRLPMRAGVAAMASQRATVGLGGGRSQVPAFALPAITARLGGEPMVLGG
jgi:hypothetical protein